MIFPFAGGSYNGNLPIAFLLQKQVNPGSRLKGIRVVFDNKNSSKYEFLGFHSRLLRLQRGVL